MCKIPALLRTGLPGQLSRAVLCARMLSTALVFLWLNTMAANAHSANQSYVYFDVTDTTLGGRIEVTMTDLAKVLSGNNIVDAPLSEETVRAQKDTFVAYFGERLKLFHQDTRYSISFDALDFLPTGVDTFALFEFTVEDVNRTPTTIQMSYDGIFSDIDSTHRGFALIASNTRNGVKENEGYITLVFSPGDGTKDLYLDDEPTDEVIKTFLEHGAWRMWLGTGHALFLITLLISAVMFKSGNQWEPAAGMGQSLKNVGLIVAVFAIAHTVTLNLATLTFVPVPVILVDALITASVIVVALRNMMPKIKLQTWKVVFVFGLFHGLGFAHELQQIGLDPAREALGLANFNLGIEIAQIALVILLFPILFALRTLSFYRPVALRAASIAFIAIILAWFVTRTTGIALPLGAANAGALQ